MPPCAYTTENTSILSPLRQGLSLNLGPNSPAPQASKAHRLSSLSPQARVTGLSDYTQLLVPDLLESWCLCSMSSYSLSHLLSQLSLFLITRSSEMLKASIIVQVNGQISAQHLLKWLVLPVRRVLLRKHVLAIIPVCAIPALSCLRLLATFIAPSACPGSQHFI